MADPLTYADSDEYVLVNPNDPKVGHLIYDAPMVDADTKQFIRDPETGKIKVYRMVIWGTKGLTQAQVEALITEKNASMVTKVNTLETRVTNSYVDLANINLSNLSASGTGVINDMIDAKLLVSLPTYRRSSDWLGDKLTITTPDTVCVVVNGKLYMNTVGSTIDISNADSWDNSNYATAANRVGKDFYIYALENEGNTPTYILSANSTVPTGYTADNSRKVGGFHCLCLDVGTPTWRNPATGANEAHWLSGYVTGDILPYSVWDLRHRAESENEGMVFSPDTKEWYDLYLSSWDGSKLVSVFGGTTADGASTKKFHGELFAECAGYVHKELISRDKFIIVAKGSNEKTNIAGSADAGTTGGHKDTANRRMISNIGLEDCCGFLWQWCKQDGGANGSNNWQNTVGDSAVDGTDNTYGQSYGAYYRASVGGSWGRGGSCGSRAVIVDGASASASASNGSRLASRERTINSFL